MAGGDNHQRMTTKGTLFKWTNYVHGWQPRYFILKNGILMYHKSEQETSFGCRGAIAVKASTFTLNEFDVCRFDVGVCDYVWYLRANTKEERDKWVLALEEQARSFDVDDHNQALTNNNNNSNATDNDNHIPTDHHVTQQQTPLQSTQNQQQDQQYLQYSDNFCDAQEHFEDPIPTIKPIQNNNNNSSASSSSSSGTNSNSNHYYNNNSDHQNTIATIDNNIMTNNNTTTNGLSVAPVESVPLENNNPLWPKIDHLTRDQLYYAQIGLGPEGSTDGWQLFAEEGQMRLYTRELEIDGLVCDPLKAVHVVKGISGYEMCDRFFSPNTRFEWETTLESMKVIEEINKNTLIFHQVHKRIWPAAQRDAVFWSHIRRIDDPKPSYLSRDDINPTTRPDLKLHNVWIVCNNSTDKPEIPLDNCVRIRLTVSLVCETYIPVIANAETVKREDVTCKIIYSSTINPGGWAPASILRAVYKREYPKFLENFSNYVISSTKMRPIVFE